MLLGRKNSHAMVKKKKDFLPVRFTFRDIVLQNVTKRNFFVRLFLFTLLFP